MWSTANSSAMPKPRKRRAREDSWGRLRTPARLAQPLTPALRTSHFPGPPAPTLQPRTKIDLTREVPTNTRRSRPGWPATRGSPCTSPRPPGSWLNLVEIFFGIITRQAIRRGTFGSVRDLIEAITAFIDGWNERCQPFVWTKDADTII